MGKYMSRREIRKGLEDLFSRIVDYTEFSLELNDKEWRAEVGVKSLKTVKYIKFSVLAQSVNGEEEVTEKIFIVPSEYCSHE